MCCPSRFYTKQIRRYQRHLKSWNSCILSIPDTNTFMPLIVIHFYYSNRFMEALSYIIHNLPPHQPQQACLACISLTVSCLLLLSTFKEVCVFTSSPLDTETVCLPMHFFSVQIIYPWKQRTTKLFARRRLSKTTYGFLDRSQRLTNWFC